MGRVIPKDIFREEHIYSLRGEYQDIYEFIRQKRASQNTIIRYISMLKKMHNSMGDLRQVTELQLKEWLARVGGEEFGDSSVNIAIAVSRNYFYNFLKRDFPRPGDDDYRHEREGSANSYKAMGDNETVDFFKAIEQLEEPNKQLYHALFNICKYGKRIGEAVYLHEDMLNHSEKLIELKDSNDYVPKWWRKGKIVYTKVNANFFKAIDDWIAIRNKIMEEYHIQPGNSTLLFWDIRKTKMAGRGKEKQLVFDTTRKNWGKPMTETIAMKDMKHILELAGIQPDRHSHMFRHRYIIHNLESTQPHKLIVSTGHSSVRALAPYTDVKDRKQVAKEMSGEM